MRIVANDRSNYSLQTCLSHLEPQGYVDTIVAVTVMISHRDSSHLFRRFKTHPAISVRIYMMEGPRIDLCAALLWLLIVGAVIFGARPGDSPTRAPRDVAETDVDRHQLELGLAHAVLFAIMASSCLAMTLFFHKYVMPIASVCFAAVACLAATRLAFAFLGPLVRLYLPRYRACRDEVLGRLFSASASYRDTMTAFFRVWIKCGVRVRLRRDQREGEGGGAREAEDVVGREGVGSGQHASSWLASSSVVSGSRDSSALVDQSRPMRTEDAREGLAASQMVPAVPTDAALMGVFGLAALCAVSVWFAMAHEWHGLWMLQDSMAVAILVWSVKSCLFASIRVALLFMLVWLAFEKLWVTMSARVFAHSALLHTIALTTGDSADTAPRDASLHNEHASSALLPFSFVAPMRDAYTGDIAKRSFDLVQAILISMWLRLMCRMERLLELEREASLSRALPAPEQESGAAGEQGECPREDGARGRALPCPPRSAPTHIGCGWMSCMDVDSALVSYFSVSALGFGFGLACSLCTAVSLDYRLTEAHMMYTMPCTLLPVVFLAAWRGQLDILWAQLSREEGANGRVMAGEHWLQQEAPPVQALGQLQAQEQQAHEHTDAGARAERDGHLRQAEAPSAAAAPETSSVAERAPVADRGWSIEVPCGRSEGLESVEAGAPSKCGGNGGEGRDLGVKCCGRGGTLVTGVGAACSGGWRRSAGGNGATDEGQSDDKARSSFFSVEMSSLCARRCATDAEDSVSAAEGDFDRVQDRGTEGAGREDAFRSTVDLATSTGAAGLHQERQALLIDDGAVEDQDRHSESI